MDSHPSKLTSHQIRLLQFMSLGVGGLLIVAVGAYFGMVYRLGIFGLSLKAKVGKWIPTSLDLNWMAVN